MPILRFVKLRDDAYLPVKGTIDSAGFDLTAPDDFVIGARQTVKVPLGLMSEITYSGNEIPYLQVVSRSGMAFKGIVVANSPGIIDADYRGEICVLLRNNNDHEVSIDRGVRIAQLIPATVPQFHVSNTPKPLSNERGTGGFGSTDSLNYEGTSTV